MYGIIHAYLIAIFRNHVIMKFISMIPNQEGITAYIHSTCTSNRSDCIKSSAMLCKCMSKLLGYTYQGGFIYELGIIGSGIISVIVV